MKSTRKQTPGFGPENEKVRSPKIVRSLGRMYILEVDAERRRLAWSATSCTVGLSLVRRTAASVHEMHQQTQLELNP